MHWRTFLHFAILLCVQILGACMASMKFKPAFISSGVGLEQRFVGGLSLQTLPNFARLTSQGRQRSFPIIYSHILDRKSSEIQHQHEKLLLSRSTSLSPSLRKGRLLVSECLAHIVGTMIFVTVILGRSAMTQLALLWLSTAVASIFTAIGWRIISKLLMSDKPKPTQLAHSGLAGAWESAMARAAAVRGAVGLRAAAVSRLAELVSLHTSRHRHRRAHHHHSHPGPVQLTQSINADVLPPQLSEPDAIASPLPAAGGGRKAAAAPAPRWAARLAGLSMLRRPARASAAKLMAAAATFYMARQQPERVRWGGRSPGRLRSISGLTGSGGATR